MRTVLTYSSTVPAIWNSIATKMGFIHITCSTLLDQFKSSMNQCDLSKEMERSPSFVFLRLYGTCGKKGILVFFDLLATLGRQFRAIFLIRSDLTLPTCAWTSLMLWLALGICLKILGQKWDLLISLQQGFTVGLKSSGVWNCLVEANNHFTAAAFLIRKANLSRNSHVICDSKAIVEALIDPKNSPWQSRLLARKAAEEIQDYLSFTI